MDALEESPAKKMRQGCASPHELDSLLMAKIGPSDLHHIRNLTPDDISEFLEAVFLDEPVSIATFLGRDNGSASPVVEVCCGHLFAENELIYSCKDCAVDETCVLCAQCFQYADHADHDFKYYQSRGQRGSCDCGEVESWKIPLTCPKHGMHSDTAGVDFDAQEPVPSTLLERKVLECSAKFFPIVAATMSNYMGKLMQSELAGSAIKTDASSHLCVVVFNDEVHSFPEVISTLKRIVRINEDEAAKLATLIDEQGFATAATYRLADLDRAKKVVSRIEETGLRTLLMDPQTVVMMMALDGMLSFLLSSAKKHPILKKRVIDVIFKADFNPQVDDANVLTRYFRYENYMTKWLKKQMQELFTLSLVSQRAKAQLMKCFAYYSGQLVSEMIEKPQLDYTLSILHFSVQIFTIPSIADLAYRSGELEKLVENVCRCVKHASERDSLSKEAMQGVVMLVSMLNYVITDSTVAERGLLMSDPFCRLLCRCLWSFQGFKTYKRQTDEHVLYDDEDIIKIITLTAHFGGLIDEFVNSISDADGLGKFLRVTLEFANENMSLDPVWEGVNVFSFQQPLLWLIGALLDRHSFIAERPLTSVDLGLAVVKAAARCITILCQIEAGMWVRNGRSVIAQGVFCMRHVSIWQKYMTICWHGLASKSCGLATLLDYLLVPVSLQISREEPLERPKYFKLLLEYVVLGLLYGTYVGLDRKQYSKSFLIHRLASGPASHSELIDSLPEFLQKSKGNDALLGEVAEIHESDTPFDTSRYCLKRSAAGHFNMFFIGLLEPARTSALENMKGSYGFDPISWLLSDEARPGTQGHLCSALGGVEGIAGMQGLIDGLCKVLHRGQFFIGLTALLVFLHRCAPGTVMDMDQSDLQQIYSAIEGLGRTGRSSQVIQVFCQAVRGFDKSRCIPHIGQEVETRSEAATRKKQQVLDAFKGRQQAFQTLNPDALLNVDEDIQDPEDYEMVLSGQCVYCQERADRDTEKYGVFGCVDLLNLYDAGSSCLNSCLHLIHVECFKKVRAARQQFCPLCKSLGLRLYLVCPKPRSRPSPPNPRDFPYEGCDDIESLGSGQEEGRKGGAEQAYSMSSPTEYFIDRGAMVGILAGWVQQYYLLQELGASSETAHLERMGRFLNAHEDALSLAAIDHSPKAQAKDGIGVFFSQYLFNNYSPSDFTPEAYGRILRTARSLVLHRLKTTWEGDDLCWATYQRLLTDSSVVMGLASLRFGIDLPRRDECVYWLFGSLISANAQPQELICTLLTHTLSCPVDLAQVPCKMGERGRLVFIDLPKDYKDLFSRLSDEGFSCKCTRGRKSYICKSQYQIYLNVHRCSIEIKYRRALFQVPAPYVNRHGEPDPGFRRGGPLYLSEAKWRGLQKIYIAGGLGNFLARNSDYDVRFEDFELEIREMVRHGREGVGLDWPLVADF